MTIEETIQTLHSIEDRAGDFTNMTDGDWVAIAAAKRHLSTLKTNQNSVYTKQELIDMGFGFDLNGNIVTLEEYNEMVKRGHEYIKNKLIEKACEWLKKTMYIHSEYDTDVDWGTTTPMDWVTSDYDTVDEFIDSFRKAMEE